jgi:hypothetical protein
MGRMVQPMSASCTAIGALVMLVLELEKLVLR